jgi:putative ABC transport system substrate-binding protein
MKRREFVTVLGGAAAWSLAARAQQPTAAPTIGFLTVGLTTQMPLVDGFRRGLKEIGFVEGQNVNIEYRSAENDYDRLSSLVDELIRQHVALIFANSSTLAALAAKAATTAIPIVFTVGVDPVKYDLVASLARPGGNITGVTFLTSELATKQFEVAHLLLPNASPIGVLVNPKNPFAETDVKNLQDLALPLKKKILVLKVDADRDFDAAFATFVQQGAGVLVVPGDSFFYNRRETLVALAGRYALPAIYYNPEFADSGGLMSYGANVAEVNRLAGGYVGRILRGEKPGDLPVQQVTKLEFVVNLKTAKALGITVPLPLLGRADRVIE